MSCWLDPVRSALDNSPVPVPFLFRDDDVGWNDEALWRLLDRSDAREVHIDLAVIPDDLDDRLAARLCSRAAGGLVHLHQHGFRHHNHEIVGRKCEFGASRTYAAQRGDIAAGRLRLDDALGRWVDPIFTPPWNRCTDVTASVLIDLGFKVLSRDHSAERFGRRQLCEVPVTVDWFATGKGGPPSAHDLGVAIARRIVEGSVQRSVYGDRPVGVMLHHAVTDAEQLSHIDQLLALVGAHPGAVSTSIYNWSL